MLLGKAVLCASLLTLGSGSDHEGHPSPGVLVVKSAHADTSTGLLTIRGENFGRRAPLVWLAGEMLAVPRTTSSPGAAVLICPASFPRRPGREKGGPEVDR